MLAPIVVDLGPDVAATAVQLVLDACNEVIARGVCVVDDGSLREVARATALARPDGSVEVVRIEVTLPEQGTASLVRELHFSARDPVVERWRSVGLAIATLVGEGERQEEQERAADAPAPPPGPQSAESPPPVAPVSSPSTSAALPTRAVPTEPELNRTAPSGSQSAPFQGSVLAGLGALIGPAFDDGSWRIGAQARLGWVAPLGWQLLGSFKYSLRALQPPTYTATWLSAELEAGYRFDLSERLSSAVSLHAGAQHLSFEALSNGVSASQRFFNPLLGASVDAWWSAAQGFALWAALDVSSIGRETRVYVAEELVGRSEPVDVSFSLGVGWWVR